MPKKCHGKCKLILKIPRMLINQDEEEAPYRKISNTIFSVMSLKASAEL